MDALFENVTLSINLSKESYIDYVDQRFPKWIYIVLLAVGISGNVLSLIVFTSHSMRNNSIFTYLAFLSMVDLLVIVFGFGDLILISYFKIILRNYSLVLCRGHTFVTYFFSHLSSFILASVSIDRAISLNFKNFSKTYCVPRTALKIILVDCLLVFSINFHSLLFLGNYYNDDQQQYSLSSNHSLDEYSNVILKKKLACASKNNTIYDKFLEPYFEWIDLFCYAILPFVVMIVCSILIIKVVFLANKSYANMKRFSTTSIEHSNSLLRLNKTMYLNTLNANQATTTTNNNLTVTTTEFNGEKHSHHGNRKAANSNGTSQGVSRNNSSLRRRYRGPPNKKKHISYMLILLNVLFFLLLSPLLFVLACLSGVDNIREYKLLINSVYVLAYSNHCLNFLFYGLSSPPYRKTVLSLFAGKPAAYRHNQQRHTTIH